MICPSEGGQHREGQSSARALDGRAPREREPAPCRPARRCAGFLPQPGGAGARARPSRGRRRVGPRAGPTPSRRPAGDRCAWRHVVAPEIAVYAAPRDGHALELLAGGPRRARRRRLHLPGRARCQACRTGSIAASVSASSQGRTVAVVPSWKSRSQLIAAAGSVSEPVPAARGSTRLDDDEILRGRCRRTTGAAEAPPPPRDSGTEQAAKRLDDLRLVTEPAARNAASRHRLHHQRRLVGSLFEDEARRLGVAHCRRRSTGRA